MIFGTVGMIILLLAHLIDGFSVILNATEPHGTYNYFWALTVLHPCDRSFSKFGQSFVLQSPVIDIFHGRIIRHILEISILFCTD